MNTDYSQQFLSEQQVHYKALKALIQKKHQIRINFSKSKTFQLLQNEVSHQYDPIINSQKSEISKKKSFKTIQPFENNKSWSLDQHQTIKYVKEKSLIEVIKRQKSKFAPIGTYQQKPLMRTSHMSRSYRKKRNKNRFSTPLAILQFHQKQTQQKQNRSINTTNKKPSIENFQNENIATQNNQKTMDQNEGIITLQCTDGQQNINILKKINLTISPNTLSIRNNTILDRTHKRFHYQSQLYSKELGNQGRKHEKILSLTPQLNSFSLSNRIIPFLQQTKPSYITERKNFPMRFISINKSRLTSVVNKQKVTRQQLCRPWTSFKNGDEKVEVKIIQQ